MIIFDDRESHLGTNRHHYAVRELGNVRKTGQGEGVTTTRRKESGTRNLKRKIFP